MKTQPPTAPGNVGLEHLTAVLDHVGEGVFTVDNDKRITFFNRAAERITGFTAAEAVGRPCRDVFRADMCADRCVQDDVRSAAAGVTDRSVRILDRYGRSRSVRVHAAALKDAAGRHIGGIETFRDVSAEEELRRLIEKSYTFHDIVSRHPAMHELFAILPDVAAARVPVLIEGESGTGKELLARAIHNLGDRRDGPFVAVNCGALPDNLLESELFGYRKGAFTDAKTDKPGRFETARGGTLFLDEVGNVSAAMQVRLLRVLQEQTFEPLGATAPVHSDARIVAATTRTSTSTELLAPRGSKHRSCSTRSSLTCIAGEMSPISSRNRVPPSASSKRPFLSRSAPVNAPRTWPNSSLSSSPSGMPPQFTGTKAADDRWLL